MFESPSHIFTPVLSDEQRAQQAILRWRGDPVSFVREVFGVEPDVWQIEALTALAINFKLSIRSGHGVGKSAFLSWAIIWFMSCFYPTKVPCTAPSAHQLFDVLWAEVRYWLRRAIPAIRDQFEVKSDRIELVSGSTETFAAARTSRKESPDALQGFHSENLLFIVDEAAGVPDIIFEVAAGALSTEHSRILLAGNPTSSTGYFARSHRPDSPFYKMRVNSEECKMVSKTYIESMRSDYGADSQIYRYRVLGEFPTQDSETVIPLALIEAAVGRNIAVSPNEVPVWGLDVARYGEDRSCLVKRYARVISEKPKTWRGLSTMELCGQVVHEWDITPVLQRPSAIYVDVIGLGAGVTDRLVELNLPAIGVNVSESPAFSTENVFRLRDELWMSVFRWFESMAVSMVDAPSLVTELASLRKGYTSSGKMRVESKDDYKKRGNRSPDEADALALTFAYQASVAIGANSPRQSDWSKPISRYVEGAYV